MDNTFTKIEEQVPEFAREQFPRFVEFLEEYYRFLSQYNTSIEHSRNADLSSQELYSFIRREVADKFPAAMINDVKLAGTIKKLYQSKGTLNAIELLFRIFFNESVIIKQPGKNVLRASDGRWKIEKSIIVRTIQGEIDFTRPVVLTIENIHGIFYIDVVKYEIPEPGQYRFFFRVNNLLQVVDDQTVRIFEGERLVYTGTMFKEPSKLNIVIPGRFWKIGQVFTISGRLKDTVVKVIGIDNQGRMQGTEIFEYGEGHDEGGNTLISPFPVAPDGANIILLPSIVGYNVLDDRYIFDYTLTINDRSNLSTDGIVGRSDALGPLSYFLEDYIEVDPVEARYAGYVVISQVTEFKEIPTNFVTTDITPEEYQQSLSLLQFQFDYIIDHRGEFVTDDGMLSNDTIRLQDNFFFQAFSYVIETQRNIQEYNNALSLVHPAGLKFFGELAKTAFISLDQDVLSYVSVNVRYAFEIVDALDMLQKLLEKELPDDEVFIVDSYKYIMGKKVTHTVEATDTPQKHPTLTKKDTQAVTDGVVKDTSLTKTETVNLGESSGYQAEKNLSVETDPVTDTTNINPSLTYSDYITDIEIDIETLTDKTVTDSATANLSYVKNYEKQMPLEEIAVADPYIVEIEKWFENTIEDITDSVSLNTVITDNNSFVSSTDSKSLNPNKAVTDSATANFSYVKNYEKQVTPTVSTVSAQDIYNINTTKAFNNDTAAAVSGSFNTEDISTIQYDDEDYSPGYAISSILITIS